MIKTKIKVLLTCFVGSCLFILMLYFSSGWITAHANGFIRKLPTHRIIGLGFVRLPDKYFYMAGGDNKEIWLANQVKRGQVLRIGFEQKNMASIRISGLDTEKFSDAGFIRADSLLYIYDGNKPGIFSGDLHTGIMTRRYWSVRFSQAIRTSDDGFILKTQTGKQNVLVKLNSRHVSVPYFLEKQGEGIFSTDGMLIKTPDCKKIFYVFYYRNRFLCLDNNLHVQYKGKTIDTVAHAGIKVAKVQSLHEITLASPPAFVSKHCAANDHWLFIHSALIADNEVGSVMQQVAPIDIYSVNDGHYAFSLYIDDFAHEKMRDFRVYGNTLVALFNDYVYFYQLKF